MLPPRGHHHRFPTFHCDFPLLWYTEAHYQSACRKRIVSPRSPNHLRLTEEIIIFGFRILKSNCRIYDFPSLYTFTHTHTHTKPQKTYISKQLFKHDLRQENALTQCPMSFSLPPRVASISKTYPLFVCVEITTKVCENGRSG